MQVYEINATKRATFYVLVKDETAAREVAEQYADEQLEWANVEIAVPCPTSLRWTGRLDQVWVGGPAGEWLKRDLALVLLYFCVFAGIDLEEQS